VPAKPMAQTTRQQTSAESIGHFVVPKVLRGDGGMIPSPQVPLTLQQLSAMQQMKPELKPSAWQSHILINCGKFSPLFGIDDGD